jgi:hypothetical protein
MGKTKKDWIRDSIKDFLLGEAFLFGDQPHLLRIFEGCALVEDETGDEKDGGIENGDGDGAVDALIVDGEGQEETVLGHGHREEDLIAAGATKKTNA